MLLSVFVTTESVFVKSDSLRTRGDTHPSSVLAHVVSTLRRKSAPLAHHWRHSAQNSFVVFFDVVITTTTSLDVAPLTADSLAGRVSDQDQIAVIVGNST